MNQVKQLFLEAFKASLENRIVDWTEEISAAEWTEFFQLADKHRVLPMIYGAVYAAPSFQNCSAVFRRRQRTWALRQTVRQTEKTLAFKNLYTYLRENGCIPVVVKGLICRSLYPNPDMRLSNDEDLFIPEERCPEFHRAFLQYGMQIAENRQYDPNASETAYSQENSPLYIELHKHLFAPEVRAYGNLNRYFDNAFGDALMEAEIDGQTYLTMEPTTHLFYLLCHAFKHFLHSGFGLRQVSDCALYANAYGAEIDWEWLLERCCEIRADLFAASVFAIGEKYLTFDPEQAHFPDRWRSIRVDETPMLEDLLDAGIYGQEKMRRHSSNITLQAVAADRRGQYVSGKTAEGILASICLPRQTMEKDYVYLRKHPYLLPAAWVQRVLRYRSEINKKEKRRISTESIRLGSERVELMRTYGIIK
ncbi:MAG: nucleotidyltransferase family protein [Eubacteriales bacterium]|nr:nucleotidyltransferase family protein [Eubacteriales bacterium]